VQFSKLNVPLLRTNIVVNPRPMFFPNAAFMSKNLWRRTHWLQEIL